MITVKLDYTLESSLERKEYVEKVVEENPDLTNDDLEVLADYLIFCMEKEERKAKKILTENRMVTINKRETSYQALADKFENGEDGIYAIKNDNKHVLFQPKQKITQHDIDTLPGMKEVQEAIEDWKRIAASATGRSKYLAKKALIEFRKQQYQIKSEYLIHAHSIHYSLPSSIKLDGDEWVDPEGAIRWRGVSLCDPKCCSGILCNYSNLKQNA